MDNGSLWTANLGDVRPELQEDAPAFSDVVIIGAGYTGLWTAYYLNRIDPNLSITIYESETVGFGASGRNGGWCMGAAMGIDHFLRSEAKHKGVELLKAMHQTVDEIGRVCQAENIDCHYKKGGTLTVATRPFHIESLHAAVQAKHSLGFSHADYTWLPEAEARTRLGMRPNYGAMFSSHCAAIQPALLVDGLAKNLRQKGVSIIEYTRVIGMRSRAVTTTRGDTTARIVVRATEGYTDSIDSEKRRLLPLYSMKVATEPLPRDVWEELGLVERETFGDPRRVVIYGQRTQDDRLALGGRGGYYFGSKRKRFIDWHDPSLERVEKTLRNLFPMLDQYEVTHRWGGLMGVARHWRPFVTYDQHSGIGSAGGYVGEGVAASNLAGRIMADLITERSTSLVDLPWVDDLARRWELEPIRWIGGKLLQLSAHRADRHEFTTNKKSIFWGNMFRTLK